MSLFKFIKYMFVGKSNYKSTEPIYDIWFDKNHMCWAAQLADENGNRIGVVGYGNNKESAVDDALYQNIDILK